MLDSLIAQGVEGPIDREAVRAYCVEAAISESELYNRLMTTIAGRFLAGRMEFWDADAVANSVWALIVEDISEQGESFEMPEPAYAIYEAFDDGEYDHGDGADPVEKYTKPLLRELLRGEDG